MTNPLHFKGYRPIGLNRRGPNGEEPMTGRRMGRCNHDNKGKTDNEILQSRNTTNKDMEISLAADWAEEKAVGPVKG